MDVRIQLLGRFAVEVAGAPVPEAGWRLRRSRTLVKLLALSPQRRLHRDQVLERLWPDGGATASGLHQVLYTARRALGDAGGARLTLHDDVVALAADGVRVDVDEFEHAAAVARQVRSTAAYAAAVELYGGELLPEDRYEDWTVARRDTLRETHLALLLELADHHAEAGEWGAVVETLRRAVVEDPLHEPAQRALMRAFAATGRRQQALAQFEQLRAALRRELEADPDPDTRRLYREILTDAGPEGPVPSSALPHQLTSFVGRARELAELERALAHTRLLTLIGPGGCGKTRLALELAARRAGAFAHGVRLVELAPVGDPALVAAEVASVLGVQPRSDRDPVDVVAAWLGSRRLLLVLDNCEHLIDACAALAQRLLRACPGLTVLATSRERLRIEGEVAWRVPSLALRTEAVELFCQRAADAAPGFSLGADDAAAVAEICVRLDGMPLALELAAARVAVLSPAQIAQRLGDALGLLGGGSRAGLTRQQTLRATLAWSHDLLDEPERALYRRLGVFAGSFGLEAAEGVCAGPLPTLARLVDKSLVQVEPSPGGHRYRLLETVRQDARERLAQAGERSALEAAHRAWYLALAEAADRDRDPDVAAVWSVERLELEYDDLRAALASAIRDDPPVALRLACALWWFWLARGDFLEGLRWLDAAVAAAPGPTPERSRALLAAGAIDIRTRVALRMVELGEEALEIVRRDGDPHAEARGLERLGAMAMGLYHPRRAERPYAQGLALARRIGDDAVVVAITQAQGVLAGLRGRNARARALLADALVRLDALGDAREPLFWALRISPVVLPSGAGGAPRGFFEDTFCLLRAVGARAGVGYVLCNVAETWRSDGDHAAARAALDRALARFRELDDVQGAAVVLNALGGLARSTGELDAGRRWLEEALEVRRRVRDAREIATTLTSLGMLELAVGDAIRGAELVDEALAIYRRNDDGPGLQGIWLNLGGLALDAGDAERACALLEEAVAIARAQRLPRHVGWSAVELADAALAVGDRELAHTALDEARTAFVTCGERRGLSYAQRLVQPVLSGC